MNDMRITVLKLFITVNRLAEYRIKKLKATVPIVQKDPIDRIIRESRGSHISIAKSLASSLPHEGTANNKIYTEKTVKINAGFF
jgi:hypothetical protein